MLIRELMEKKSSTQTNETAWVILYTTDKVILGKRSPTAKNPNQWNFFGGHVDQGESAIDAAIRELQEETGYIISPSQLKEITKIGDATYYSSRINDPEKINTTDEVSKIKGFKLTDLPNNLHSKTENFFTRLELLLSK